MNILEYLLKASVGLALFLGGYLLIYRHDTFFKWNRIYFLIGSLAVLLLPFINLKSLFEKPTLTNLPVLNFVPRIAYLPIFRQSQMPLVEKGFWDNFSIIEILIIAFLLGALVMFGRFLLQCFSLYSLKRKAVEVPFQSKSWLKIIKERLYFLTQSINPFSFFNWIFVSPSLHTEQELNEILCHEQVHVRQWHSLDVMLAEVLVAVLWFNPLVWIWRSMMKQNLEFLTDQTVLLNGIEAKQYQYNLLKISGISSNYKIVNHFNYQQLKSRIAMMNKQKSPKINALKTLLALPMLAVLLTAFNKSTSLSVADGSVKNTVEKVVAVSTEPAEWTLSGKVTDQANKALANAEVLVFKHGTAFESMNGTGADALAFAKTKTDEQGLYKIIINEPLVRVAYRQVGLPLQWLDISKNWTADVKITADGSSDVSVKDKAGKFSLSGTIGAYNGTSSPTSTAPDVLNWLLNRVNKVSQKMSIDSMDKVKVEQKKIPMDPQTEKAFVVEGMRGNIKITGLRNGQNLNPIYVLDGVQLTDSNKDLSNINPKDIARIDVLKDEKAVAMYGQKGKGGVVLITTKKSLTKAQLADIEVEERKNPVQKVQKPNDENPKYMIDQVEVSKTIWENISSDNVVSVEVTDEPSKIKNDPKGNRQVNILHLKSAKTNVLDSKDILYIMDGVEVSSQQVETLSPVNFESLDIIKQADQLKPYGEKGKNGVIVITTKKKKK